MDLFCLLQEVLKVVVRVGTSHLLLHHLLPKEKTTRRRRKHEGGSRKD